MTDEVLRRLESIERILLKGNGSPSLVQQTTENRMNIQTLMQDRQERKSDFKQIKYIFIAAILANLGTITAGVLAWLTR